MADKPDLKNTHSFTIDLETASGENFKGTFVVHRPTVGERIKIGNLEARELEGLLNVDADTAYLARIVSTFEVVVDSAPVWFDKPKELRDLEVIQEVYAKYIQFLGEFQRKPEPKGSSTE